MNVLHPSEVYRELSTFSEAAKVARRAADELQEEVAVKRSAHGWLVLLPPGGRYELSRITTSTESSVPYDPDHEQLVSELLSDQDDYHRADEDGWFYED